MVNNFGKGGGAARTLRFVLTFRSAIFTEHDPVTADFVRHLLGAQKNPRAGAASSPCCGWSIPRRKKSSSARSSIPTACAARTPRRWARSSIKQLGLPELPANAEGGFASDKTHMNAWDIIKELIASRASPNEITEAIRKQLHAKYDADEVKQSWLVLAESDPMSLVRVFCLLPYLPDGQTDPIARAVLESYANRLTHEKYAATYAKVIHGAAKHVQGQGRQPGAGQFHRAGEMGGSGFR